MVEDDLKQQLNLLKASKMQNKTKLQRISEVRQWMGV